MYQLQALRGGKGWVNLGCGENLDRLKFNSGIWVDFTLGVPFIGPLGDTYRFIFVGV